jgi:hypothetical protein
MEAKRTPGQAEGTEEDIDNLLSGNAKGQKSSQGKTGAQQHDPLDRESGRTPGQAEGTEEQAEGSLRNQKKK